MIETILAAVDGSRCAHRALLEAAVLATACHAHVLLVYVVDDSDALLDEASIDRDEFLRRAVAYGQRVLADASAFLGSQGVSHGTMLVPRPAKAGSVADTLLGEARRANADLIVMGTRGRRGTQRLIMGSVSQEVLARCMVPVLLVRSDDDSQRIARAVPS
ncbi:Nucleotide-binding universal stress protein, UspA family [Cupriavidus sp. YR651]|uniref:universal stress protein n=1 Tax=Cupriavidus sp. YR651 TaxID=1855315 RepID=UPI000885CC1C|nr:universal stress protein [Cupriavidus sp. YR651]SDD84670.1 Nucleotide-binding universal stress protein, UspA family [Cupriavidus sp. YR651]